VCFGGQSVAFVFQIGVVAFEYDSYLGAENASRKQKTTKHIEAALLQTPWLLLALAVVMPAILRKPSM
jgi:hypothetical protein